jgi:uncharacterized damage-inducible protein DinB
MVKHDATNLLSKVILDLLQEAFEKSQGYFLDPNTSLFETLKNISAEQASIPVGGKCATLAAQVSHITFYLQSLEGVITGGGFQQVDWGEIWRTVNQVTHTQWENIQAEAQQKYQHICSLVREKSDWSREEELDSILGIIAHSAYHLGEIRQALCTIQA